MCCVWCVMTAARARTHRTLCTAPCLANMTQGTSAAHALAFKERGNAYFQRRLYNEAKAAYTEAIIYSPVEAALYTNRASASAALDKFDESLADSLEAIKLDSNCTKGHYRAGLALSKLGRNAEALVHLKRAAELEPGHASLRDALSAALALVESEPKDVAGCKERGNSLFKLGKFDDAISWYTRALDLCASMPASGGGGGVTCAIQAILLTNRAECHRQKAEPLRVIDDCTAALAIDPQSMKAFIRRGLAYEYLEKYEFAFEDFKSALTLDATSITAMEGTLRISRVLNREEQARQDVVGKDGSAGQTKSSGAAAGLGVDEATQSEAAAEVKAVAGPAAAAGPAED